MPQKTSDMNKILLLMIMGMSLLVYSGCGKDDNNPADENLLRYDGENATGPLLAAGNYETAVRFTRAQTEPFSGRKLIGVRWFTGPLPAACELRVYGKGQGNTPGTLLYSANVINQVRAFGWTYHTLSTPVTIEADDLWISVAFTHSQQGQSIGCDAGPNRANGDWIFDEALGEWQTYTARTGESVNWNIRGVVGE